VVLRKKKNKAREAKKKRGVQNFLEIIGAQMT